MIIVWPSTASAGMAASAAAAARDRIAIPLVNLISAPLLESAPGLARLPDHLQDGELLGRAVRVALILQHLVLSLGFIRRAGAAARQDVHDVRIAIGVGAAAEAVLTLVLVDLAGEHVLALGEPLVGLDEDLVAPLRGITAAELVEVHRGRDRPSGALDASRDDGRPLLRRRHLLRLRLDAARGLRREDHHPVPLV